MKLFILLLTLSIQSAYATFSLNSLNIPLDEDNPTVLAINGKLFYLDENRHVWINQSSTLSSTKIMIDGQAVIAKTSPLYQISILDWKRIMTLQYHWQSFFKQHPSMPPTKTTTRSKKITQTTRYSGYYL